jgi:hypothetical protein
MAAVLNDYAPPADVAELNEAALDEIRSSWKSCGLTPSDVDQIVCAWMRAASLRIRRGLPVTLEYVGSILPRIEGGEVTLIKFVADDVLFDAVEGGSR